MRKLFSYNLLYNPLQSSNQCQAQFYRASSRKAALKQEARRDSLKLGDAVPD